MNKKILFFNPYCCWSFHFETDLEIIKKYVDNGDSVTYLTCDGDLTYCEPNPKHELSICQACIERRIQGFELLNLTSKIRFLNLVNLSQSDKKVISQFPKKTKTLRGLKSLHIENFDLGLSLASSLISSVQEPYPNPSFHQKFIEKNIKSALIVYFSIQNHIKANQPDKMYIFNGRFPVFRAAMRSAQLLKIDFDVHERSEVRGKYTLTINNYPHDLENQKAKIISAWNNSRFTEPKKHEIGSQWFLDRKAGKDQGWLSFTKYQNQTLKLIDYSKFKVVIFNSSQDELEAISGWENPIYKSQNQAIFKLAFDLQNEQNLDIYLRIHPNLSNVDNSQTKSLEKLKGRYSNFHIIDAEDLINSYDLMSLADLVITYGSTMGVEAAFYNKISVLAGHALYEDLETCSVMASHDELVDLLKNRERNLSSYIKEERKKNAIKYGFYMATNGVDFILFEQTEIFKMTFKDDKTLNYATLMYRKVISKLRRAMIGAFLIFKRQLF